MVVVAVDYQLVNSHWVILRSTISIAVTVLDKNNTWRIMMKLEITYAHTFWEFGIAHSMDGLTLFLYEKSGRTKINASNTMNRRMFN